MPATIAHGIGAKVSEARCVIAAADRRGRPLVFATVLDLYGTGYRTSLLVIDPTTGETEQYWHPCRESENGPDFAMLFGSNGRLYVMPGQTFLEFDPEQRAWTFSQDTESGVAMSMTEGPDGTVYAASIGSCNLLAFDPEKRTCEILGRLDPEEKYGRSMATDDAGWLYAGIGTARASLVAFDPRTRERRQLVPDSERDVGTGRVHKGQDGKVYGRLSDAHPWLRLHGGQAEPVDAPSEVAPCQAVKYPRLTPFPVFSDGTQLVEVSSAESTLTILAPDGRRTTREIRYESEGAQITSMFTGPGGRVYGSTAHPMTLFAWDPATDDLTNYGTVRGVKGGNFCGMDALGDTIYAAGYAGGWLHAYDTTRPWHDSADDNANPRLLGKFSDDIHRPRTGFAHPDGRHFVMAGYPQNGAVGGGMAIHDASTGETDLLTHRQLVPLQSTVTLAALPNGDLVGGTSIATPCGARPLATTAKLYIMDWASRKIAFETEPMKGCSGINCLRVGPRGGIYALTGEGVLLTLDPGARSVIRQQDLSEFGSPLRPDQSLLVAPGGRLYVVLSNAILAMDPGDGQCRKVADLPAPAKAGSGLSHGRIFYASGSHVWSCAAE